MLRNVVAMWIMFCTLLPEMLPSYCTLSIHTLICLPEREDIWKMAADTGECLRWTKILYWWRTLWPVKSQVPFVAHHNCKFPLIDGDGLLQGWHVLPGAGRQSAGTGNVDQHSIGLGRWRDLQGHQASWHLRVARVEMDGRVLVRLLGKITASKDSFAHQNACHRWQIPGGCTPRKQFEFWASLGNTRHGPTSTFVNYTVNFFTLLMHP